MCTKEYNLYLAEHWWQKAATENLISREFLGNNGYLYVYVLFGALEWEKNISEGIAVSYEKSENGDNFWII